ncbi:hypothetical protein ACFV2N_29730 [Streptomyces sp. NPDC059680]|uniref:hypothetical protein n=1 Tax=Streptomyces sp. NPDC059680 TaxID=3346904 RepID=UPI0036B5F66B
MLYDASMTATRRTAPPDGARSAARPCVRRPGDLPERQRPGLRRAMGHEQIKRGA